MNGRTYNSTWLIETDYPGSPGTFLRSVPRGGLTAIPVADGALRMGAQYFKLIEVTSDKLVIELYPLSTGFLPKKTYEFHRVK